eukprot:tig00000571_g2197.t1
MGLSTSPTWGAPHSLKHVHNNINLILGGLCATTCVSGAFYLSILVRHTLLSSAGTFVCTCASILCVSEILSFIWTVSCQVELIRPIRRPTLSFSKLAEAKLVPAYPMVAVLIPTCGEALEVVRSTFVAAMGIRYPPDRLRVCLLDDGASAEKQALVAMCDLPGSPAAVYLSRPAAHRAAHPAKAGNINHALASPACADAEFFAVLDADMCAEPGFLDALLPHFYRRPAGGKGPLEASGAAYVQSPQAFGNLPESDPLGHAMGFFYTAGVFSRDGWGSTPNCGTNLVMRTAAVRAIGGFQYGLCEDLATAVALQRAGFGSAYCPQALARGLAPPDLPATLVQRSRWSAGAFQVLFSGLLSPGSGLPLRHRVFYLNYIASFLYSFLVPVYLALPLVYAATGRWPLPAALGPAFAARRLAPYLAAHWAFLLAASANAGCGLVQLWRERQRLACFFPVYLASFARAAAERLLPGRRLPFVVTGAAGPGRGFGEEPALARLAPVAPQAAAFAACAAGALALAARLASGADALGSPEGGRAALALIGLLYAMPFFANVLSAALWGVPPAGSPEPRRPPAAVLLPALTCGALWALARVSGAGF